MTTKEHLETSTLQQQNESLIEQLLIEHSLSFPLDRSQVAPLAGLLGYDCPAAVLDEIAQNELSLSAQHVEIVPVWLMDEVLALCDSLESRRSWQCTSRHDRKKTRDELQRDRKEELALTALIDRWQRMPLINLIAEMVPCEDVRHRRVMSGMVITALERLAEWFAANQPQPVDD